MGIYAEHVIVTDNGRQADDVTRKWVAPPWWWCCVVLILGFLLWVMNALSVVVVVVGD